MTDRFVGIGGSNGNSGLTWALRKLTLNGVEDTPVVAGDTIYVGPGTHRNQLVMDVSGSSGNPITYVADVSGVNTDGIGGVVRITNTDDDINIDTTNRENIIGAQIDYRTFRGFHFDFGYGFSPGNAAINADRCDNLIIEDCVFGPSPGNDEYWHAIQATVDANSWNLTIRRCMFDAIGPAITLQPYDAGPYTTNIRIENCILFGPSSLWFDDLVQATIKIGNISGIIITNCTFLTQIYSWVSYLESYFLYSTASGTCYLYNCVVSGERSSVEAGDFTEDYNSFGKIGTAKDADFTNGGNSDNDPILFNPPTLIQGHAFDWMYAELAPYSPVIGQPCNSEAPADDFFGITRPTSDAKKTRGAIQNSHIEKDISTIEGDWPYSIKLNDAMTAQFIVPVTGQQMSFSVNVLREADYAGTLPQMIIKQPGESDRTTTDTGSASQWNNLSDAYTPASSTPYVVVELRSNNTAAATSYATHFSSLDIK